MLREEYNTVCQMYNLINMYSVPIPLDDQIEFSQLQTNINKLQKDIDKAAAVRDSNMNSFSSSLHNDINDLKSEVKKVKLKLQVRREFVFIFVPMNAGQTNQMVKSVWNI